MLINILKGTIHRARVIEAELDYVGSITIDADLLEASGIREYEKVCIANVDNGKRFETYVIAGEPGSGMICLNGAAAHCAQIGDSIIIMAYALMTPEEAEQHHPHVVFVNDENRAVRISAYEKHGKLENM